MVIQPMSFGFVCPEVNINAVQVRPSADEQLVIDEYRAKHEAAHGYPAHGLHYLIFPGVEEAVAVWLPIEKETASSIRAAYE
jgi:hypothetical protein